ncbi:MAG TPA: TRAP transporter small permease subunit [Marinobacter sp.]|uniref:TRAP transporter small permease subunit n=1 Tax=Marinobacter sp. TaxID=50741 RepID=UPI0026035F21|nr:TRAP transporter small permease subunit [Marinobacter sp.]HET8802821.1 TRAP transporter small permease subunit [Marinobacter sp.]
MLRQANSFLDRLLDRAQTGSLWLARAGGALILLTVVIVTIEVVTRQILGRSAMHATEITGYIMAVSTSWCFAYTLLCKAHIRIDALYLNFSTRVRAVLDLLALLSMALFCVLVVGAVFDITSHSFSVGAKANTPLATPLWIPQSLWLAGLTWFSFVVCLLTLRVILALLKGDTERVQALAGSPTLDEQIEHENREAHS